MQKTRTNPGNIKSRQGLNIYLQACCIKGRDGFQNNVCGLVVINIERYGLGDVQTEHAHDRLCVHRRAAGNQVKTSMKSIHNSNKLLDLLQGINTDRVSNHSFVLQKTSLLMPGLKAAARNYIDSSKTSRLLMKTYVKIM